MLTADGQEVGRIIFDYSPRTIAEGSPFLETHNTATFDCDVVSDAGLVKQGASYRIGGFADNAGDAVDGQLYLPYYDFSRYEFGFDIRCPAADSDISRWDMVLRFNTGAFFYQFGFRAESAYGVTEEYQFRGSAGYVPIPTFDNLWRSVDQWYRCRLILDLVNDEYELIELNNLRLTAQAIFKTSDVVTLAESEVKFSIVMADTKTAHIYIDRFWLYALN